MANFDKIVKRLVVLIGVCCSILLIFVLHHAGEPQLQIPKTSSSGIAYIIRVDHGQTTEFLGKLVTRLWRPQDTFVIHLDAKIDASRKLTLESLPHVNASNVFFVTFRAINPTKIETVLTSLDSIQFALENGNPWSHVVHLSGDSYPLQKPSIIQELVTLQPKKIWTESYYELENNGWVFDCHSDEQNHPFQQEQLKHGTPFWIFTRSFAEWLISSAFARNFLSYISCGNNPDAVYFQTVLWNSPFKDGDPDPRAMFSVWTNSTSMFSKAVEWLQRHNKPTVLDSTKPVCLPRSLPLNEDTIPAQYRLGYLFARIVQSPEIVDYIEKFWECVPSPYLTSDGMVSLA